MRTLRTITIQMLMIGMMFMTVTAIGSAAEPIWLSIVTGPTSGTWYPLGGGMTKIVEKYFPEIAVTLETGQGVKNARVIAQNPKVFGLLMPDIAFFAFKGEREFKEKLPIRHVMSGNMAYQHIVSLEEFGINQIEDLRGKAVGVGAPASNAETNCRMTLEVHGMTYNDIKPKYLSTTEIVAALQDKLIVAGFITAGLPVSGVMELAVTQKVKLVPIRKEMLAKIEEKFPFFSAGQIPAKEYKGQTAPVDAVVGANMLVAHADLSPDVVYKIIKAISEHSEELGQYHPAGKFWTAERSAQKVGIPRHPGAEKYLREKGLLK